MTTSFSYNEISKKCTIRDETEKKTILDATTDSTDQCYSLISANICSTKDSEALAEGIIKIGTTFISFELLIFVAIWTMKLIKQFRPILF